MALVSSLDKDLSRLRLQKYSLEAAQEVKDWISEVLGERLGNGDLMAELKNGTLLCRLANLLNPTPPIRFKASAMPFVQMENISHFLSFLSKPPVSLPPHDLFLTVDLFEQKDPAQVLQCLSAFSRAANLLNPLAFPKTIGGLKGGVTSPHPSTPGGSSARSISGGSAAKSSVSSWSQKTDEKNTMPAWNVAQYGYMGGASQGNQGVAFGARRQITATPLSNVSSLADREKKRREEFSFKEKEQDAKRQKEEAERKKLLEDKRRREEADRKKLFEDSNRRRLELEENEKAALELGRKKLKEEDERKHLREEREREQLIAIGLKEEETRRVRDAEVQRRLEYEKMEREKERERVRELERELAKARERERIYEAEKEERRRQDTERMRREAQESFIRAGDPLLNRHRAGYELEPPFVVRHHKTGERETPAPSQLQLRTHKTGDAGRREQESEGRFLQSAWTPSSSRPTTPIQLLQPQITPDSTKPPPRALPTPPPRKLPPAPTRSSQISVNTYFGGQGTLRRRDSWELNDDAALQRQEEREKEQAYKWASMSLLERERERERERQREWEMHQREQAEHRGSQQLEGELADDGSAWDVNQYGYADDILDLY
ncbi:calponin [Rhizina undulata]